MRLILPVLALVLPCCLCAAEPAAEVDALVASARSAAEAGDEAAAMAAIDKALAVRPRDAALWALKGDLALKLHNPTLARTAYREADRLDPQDRELDNLGELPSDGRHWQLEIGGARDGYDQGLPMGSALRVGLSYRQVAAGAHRAWQAGITAARIDHAGEADGALDARGGVQVLPRLEVHAGAGIAPGATTIARWRVEGGIVVTVHQELALLMDVQHAAFADPAHEQVLAAPGLRIGADSRPVQLVGRLLAVTDHADAGGTVHGTAWQAGVSIHPAAWRGWRLDGTYTQGDTAAAPLPIGPSRTWAAALEIPLDQTLALRLEGAAEDRTDAYRRTTLGGALLVRF